jgi:hypothetical protein
METEKIYKENETLRKKNEKYKIKIEQLDEQYRTKIEQLEEKCDKLIDLSVTNAKTTGKAVEMSSMAAKSLANTTSTILKFLNDYCKNAPELQYEREEFESFSLNILSRIITDEKGKLIVDYISELLIKHYKKKDFREQSIWSTDKNRHHYLDRKRGDGDNIIWCQDVFGEHVKITIIKPLARAITYACNDKLDDIINEGLIILPEYGLEREIELSRLKTTAFNLGDREFLNNIVDAVFKKISKSFIFDKGLIQKHLEKIKDIKKKKPVDD